MKRFIAVVALIAACRTTPSQETPIAGRADDVRAGAKLFEAHCSECHGADARGRIAAPPLRSARISEMPPARLFAVITNGRLRRGMPAWSRLPDERRWQIVSYLRALGAPYAGGADPPSARPTPR